MLEFVPHEYEVVEGEGEINFIVFSDSRLVPREIPENVTYIAKLNGSIYAGLTSRLKKLKLRAPRLKGAPRPLLEKKFDK